MRDGWVRSGRCKRERGLVYVLAVHPWDRDRDRGGGRDRQLLDKQQVECLGGEGGGRGCVKGSSDW